MESLDIDYCLGQNTALERKSETERFTVLPYLPSALSS